MSNPLMGDDPPISFNKSSDMDIASPGPEHPGKILRTAFKAFGISVEEAARRSGIYGTTLRKIVYGERKLGPIIALKMERLTGISALYLLRKQAELDLHILRPQMEKDLSLTRRADIPHMKEPV